VRTLADDLGMPCSLPAGAVTRVVSLVPSLTEAMAATRASALVGATDWCSRPPGLEVERVRGTKNPHVARVVALAPELVVANQEENRELDVRRLREAGIPVWVTVIEDVPQALVSMERLLEGALGWGVPEWLSRARRAWAGPVPHPVARVAVPIWRDPWMVVGSSTFTGDLLARAGLENAFGGRAERYPHVDLAELDRADLDVVLLPDEPYEFTSQDGPESFERAPTRLVSGRLITWYGPSLVEAREALDTLVREVAAG
jgi:ABC-type Fe3+-hydroxamate transport system substrate-binding protein